jgi:cupin superfamily acireductone dioxygenase involved in methionine salvage
MVKIYYYDNLDGEPWLPHEGSPAPSSTLEEVGVFAANFENREEVERLAKEQGYKNMDEVS